MNKANIFHFFIEYWGVLLIILSTGATFLTGNSYALAFLLLLLTSLYFFIFDKNSKQSIRKKSIGYKYLVYFQIWVFLNIFIIHTDVVDYAWVATLFCSITSFFIISRYPFARFKRIYLDIISFLALISIIVFYGVEMGVFTPQLATVREAPYMFVYGHVVGWEYIFGRNAGIFHEPGAYQYYLNFALIFLMREITQNKLNRIDTLRILVILFALYTTKSTMAYVAVFVILATILLFSKALRRHKILIPLTLFVVPIFGLLIMQSDVVDKKVGDDAVNQSAAVRTRDLITQSEMTIEEPLWGYGIHTTKFVKRNFGEVGGCIGLVNESAQLGLLWLIIFLFVVYKGIKRMKLGVPTFFIIIAFILIECNENYSERPLTYLFVFNFLNYKDFNISKLSRKSLCSSYTQ